MTLEDVKRLLEKATPGPWEIEHFLEPDEVYFANGLFDVGPAMVGDDCPNDAANAALIAAAPELAALLVRAVEALRPFAYPVPHDWYAIVGRNEHGHPLNTEGVQRQSARSLLRELGVEA